MEVQLTGFQEVLQSLNSLNIPEELENKALNKAGEITQKAIIAEAPIDKLNPVDHASLHKNIKLKRPKDGEVIIHTGGAYHAHIIELGRSAGSTITKGGRKVTWGKINPNPFFSRGHEQSKSEADIVDLVSSTLESIGVKSAFQAYPSGQNGLPAEYVTFLEYTSNPSLEAADKEIETERLIQVNVWSKGNYHQLVEDIRNKLEEAGFQRTSEFDAPYTDGDSHFNKVMRCDSSFLMNIKN